MTDNRNMSNNPYSPRNYPAGYPPQTPQLNLPLPQFNITVPQQYQYTTTYVAPVYTTQYAVPYVMPNGTTTYVTPQTLAPTYGLSPPLQPVTYQYAGYVPPTYPYTYTTPTYTQTYIQK